MARIKNYTEENRKGYTVKGGKLVVFSDTHFSSTFQGKHISYIEECYFNMDRMLSIVKEVKPVAVFLLGDIIGVKERNLRDHQFLMRVIMFFGSLYSLTNGNVYTVKGNHDIGDFSDFDFIVGLGYLKNPLYVDFVGDHGVEVRFHFVNYGDEKKKLEINQEASNIVLGHNDYYIDGVTNWYSRKSKLNLELKNLNNFCGVDLVLSGHIHAPSEEVLYAVLPDGESIGLFYLGSPARVAERFDDCWYVVFEYSKESNSTTYDARLFGLKNASEVFYSEDSYKYLEGDPEELEKEERRKDVLNEIITEVINSRLAIGNVFEQIERLPAKQRVKEIAKEYLKEAVD